MIPRFTPSRHVLFPERSVTGCDEEVEEELPGTILGLTLLRSITIIKATRSISTLRQKWN